MNTNRGRKAINRRIDKLVLAAISEYARDNQIDESRAMEVILFQALQAQNYIAKDVTPLGSLAGSRPGERRGAAKGKKPTIILKDRHD